MNTKTVKEIAAAIEDDIIQMRRTIHRNPELGGHEKETVEYIAKELKAVGLEPKTDYSQHCVTTTICGDPNGKTIMLRADIDALPIREESGVAFSSQNDGIMHACGHDCHTASLLGAAKILSQLKEQLKGTVKFIFQPAEEVKEQGASICVAEGVMENPHVDFVVGTHINSSYPTGSVAIEPGPVTSYPDAFCITFHGKAAHGSAPHLAIDALQAGVAAYNMIAGLPQKISGMEPHVIQVCYFKADSAPNICADTCSLGGTSRTLTPESRALVRQKLIGIAQAVCSAYGTEYEFSGFDSKTLPVVNDAHYTAKVAETVSAIIPGKIYSVADKLGGEDFSYYLQNGCPGVFVYIGTNSEDPQTHTPLHNGKLVIDERALTYEAQIYAQVALDFLSGKYDC